MNNATNSPPPNKQSKASGRGIMLIGRGCAVAVVGLLGALVVVLGLWGPTLLAQLAGQRMSNVTISIENQATTQASGQLAGYGWVDEAAGRAHIPIERAIVLVAEQGLPVAEPTTTSPDATSVPATIIDSAALTFNQDILPIFQQRCGECHGDDEQEEGLKLTTYRAALGGSQNGTVIEPGAPDSSYLVELIVKGQMPKHGDPLPQAEIDMIIAWIAAGAAEN